MLSPAKRNRADYGNDAVGKALYEESVRQYERDMEFYRRDPEGYGGPKYSHARQEEMVITDVTRQAILEAVKAASVKR